jgi:HPr kinase/phosphorylase
MSEPTAGEATRPSPTIHASAVLVGAGAVLIRGPARSGKSRLALALIEAAASGLVPFARLVGDDRVHIEPTHGRLLVRPAEALEGLLEVAGLGIRRFPFEPVAVVRLVVDLETPQAERLPSANQVVTIVGISIPRLSIGPAQTAIPIVLAALRTQDSGLSHGFLPSVAAARHLP